MKNKNVFQLDVYRPLVDRIPYYPPGGVCVCLCSKKLLMNLFIKKIKILKSTCIALEKNKTLSSSDSAAR